MYRFSAAIYKIGINPVVDPPDRALQSIFVQAGRSKGSIPVSGTLNGAEFIQTLVKFRGAWRLYVNGPMLKASGLKVGDTARIEIRFDPKPRETPMPKKFAEALRKDVKASAEFENLSPSRKKEILRYLGALKTPESLEKNVERVLQQLYMSSTEKEKGPR